MGEVEEEVAHGNDTEFLQSDEIVGSDGGKGIEWGIWGHGI